MITSLYNILSQHILGLKVDFPIALTTLELEYLRFVAHVEPEKSYKQLAVLQNSLKDATEKAACTAIMKNLTNNGIKVLRLSLTRR